MPSVNEMIRVNGNVIEMPFQFYTSSDEAFPAFLAAGHIVAVAESFSQTKKIFQELFPYVDFGECSILFDKLQPGGSKFVDWVFRIVLGNDEQANVTADRIRRWLMGHKISFGCIAAATILAIGGYAIAAKYIDAENRGDFIQNSENILRDVSLTININNPTLYTELAQKHCHPTRKLMKLAAAIVAPMKRTGGTLKLGGREEGIVIPQQLIRQMPEAEAILPEETLINVPLSQVTAQITQSSIECTDRIWKLKLQQDNLFSGKSIRAILDVENGVTPERLMWRENVIVDVVVSCKQHGTGLRPLHLKVTRVYTDDELRELAEIQNYSIPQGE